MWCPLSKDGDTLGWQGWCTQARAGGKAVSGLEPRVLVGTLLLGSGEEEEPSCRGGGAAGKVSSLSPLLGTRCFLLAGKSGGAGRRV